MPVIRVSDATWERLERHVKSFKDKPEDIVVLALDALDQQARSSSNFTKPVSFELPPALVDLNAADHAVPKARRVRGEKLPQKEFRVPLIRTVFELGGSAEVASIRKALQGKLSARLSAADYKPVSSGEERWWNAACWERADLVRDGIFRDGSERGVWELSQKGMELARTS